MTPRQDPYRVLGLVPGATAGEIRSAYRRLAKLHHPDTAGERSLPRFLAIQAAYEELVDGEGRIRGRGWPGRGDRAPSRPTTAADGSAPGAGASAHRASRDGWRARQAGSARGGSAASGPAASGAGRRPEGDAAGARRTGARGPGAAPGSRAGPKTRAGGQRTGAEGRPDRRTARPGSTTYDEAAQPLDPSWEGGAWYGASSGRYWTLNPREYADPRKHGPEYQERARRAVRLEGSPGAKEPPTHMRPPGWATEVASASTAGWAGTTARADEARPPAAPQPPRPQRHEAGVDDAEGADAASARRLGRLVWRSSRRRAP